VAPELVTMTLRVASGQQLNIVRHVSQYHNLKLRLTSPNIPKLLFSSKRENYKVSIKHMRRHC